jgi:DNA polymerase I
VPAKNGGVATVNVRHGVADVLEREGVATIDKEVDHRWERPLTADHLHYAADDVRYLIRLYEKLRTLAAERDLLGPYELVRKVLKLYMDQQSNGVPFDVGRYLELRESLEGRLEILKKRLEEHAPEHPEGGNWVWRNYNKPDAVDEHGNRRGRNGALRALACAGTPLADLQKPTRLAALKRYERAPLLTALDPYLKLADLESDTRDWLELYYEDGRLYPNVNFFSQVTGRSAYSHPALQNIAKEPEFEGGTFRDCIRAPEGHAIVKCDYSAQELRILAHITQDENLLGAFRAQAEGTKTRT